ncbi:DUF4395 family protein, partial [Nocardia cyriacigeorgica]|uniref:DUF4395 family protein n=1 Tax=Nocardia cyriacigeorgica TaxID=135487 RepID=UPI003CC7DABE
ALVAAQAVVFALGAVNGPKRHPYGRIYANLVAPRRPPRGPRPVFPPPPAPARRLHLTNRVRDNSPLGQESTAPPLAARLRTEPSNRSRRPNDPTHPPPTRSPRTDRREGSTMRHHAPRSAGMGEC